MIFSKNKDNEIYENSNIIEYECAKITISARSE